MEKKKKVLMVHNYYQIGGGEHTVFENEVKLLRDHGHKVITYTRSNDELRNDKWKLFLLPFTTIWSFKTYREVKKIIKDEQIDIVHCQNTFPLISPSVYYAAWKMKVPVVQTVHNFRFICPDGILYRDGHICEDCVNKGLICALAHGCYRHSKVQTFVVVAMLKIHRWLGTYRKLYLICLTEFNKNKLLEVNKFYKKPVFDSKKFFIKPNFVFENTSNENLTNEYLKMEDYFLYIGRIEKEKGVETIVKAFKNILTERLLLAGAGNDLEECKMIAENSSNIYFCGQVEHSIIPTLIHNSKALVIGSEWYEGFPMVIAEAFSQGKPVICCRLGNADSLVMEGVTGYKFEAGSPSSLIEAVNKINISNVDFESTTREYFDDNMSDKSNFTELTHIYDEIFDESYLIKRGGGVTTDKFVDQFVFAGRLDQSKGIRILLEAWKLLNNEVTSSRLIICGNGPEEQWCKNFVENNQLSNVEMVGYVTNERVKSYIASSKALILPSQCYEAFGMVVIEAYSCGVPVICTNIGGPSSIVENGINGFQFINGSTISLKNTISLIKHSDFNSDEIKKIYKQCFGAEKNYQELREIYRNIGDKSF